MAAEEGNPAAGWISKLFPQQSPVSAPPKKHQQKRGGRSQRKSTRRQRGSGLQEGEGEVEEQYQLEQDQLEQDQQEQDPQEKDAQELLESRGYTVIPPVKEAPPAEAAPAEEEEEAELGGGARRSRRGSKKSGSRKAKGGAAVAGPTRTSQSVQYGGRDRVVYQGPRGGKYIKKGGEFVPISKL